MKYLLTLLLLGLLVIRLIGLSNLPNGLTWDELDNIYQAYSLDKTGKDMFGTPLPVLLHSVADYKSSLYIYATVPFVKVPGLTPLAARAPGAIFGIVAILALIVLVAKKSGLAWGIVAGILFGLSPWWFSFSRLSYEAVGMLALFLVGLACLQKAFTAKPKFLILAGLFWSLGIWTYSTGKLFIPIFGLIVLIKYFSKIWQFDRKIVATTIVLTTLITLPVLWQSVFGKGNTRFNEISIFTDPTTVTEVNSALQRGQLSSGVTKEVGLTPRPVDRLANNKYKFWTDQLITNYLSAFSTDFLFTRGDPNLRQSPGQYSIGELQLLDFVLLGLGLYWIIAKKYFGVLVWLLLAPLPAIVTRDGAGHATRLLFMLPPLIILLTGGLKVLSSKPKILLLFLAFYSYFVFYFGYYYFSYYRFESMIPFHWGFQNVAQIALDNSSKYNRVIVDLRHESDLMAFLVQARYDPALLQSQMPLAQTEVIHEVLANKFGNIYILAPGERSWNDYYREKKIPDGTLVILAADQTTILPITSTIYYPNGAKAFYISAL